MIIDALKNLNKYQQIIPFSKEILDYLKSNDIASLEIGKYPIVEESAFILIQEYQTKTESEKKWESHQKYIDIQIILKGQEYMGYSPTHLLKVKNPYNEEKDVMHYENNMNDYTKLLVIENYFCIFFPEDAHKPGLHLLKEQNIKKAVIKVIKL